MCVCSGCRYWEYTKFTEERYGMGVGICRIDHSQTFCDHVCPFCVTQEQLNETD